MPVTEITSAQQFISLMATRKLLIVKGSAEWCAPCHMMAPIVEELSNTYAEEADFVEVDVDKLPSLAEQWVFGFGLCTPGLKFLVDLEKPPTD